MLEKINEQIAVQVEFNGRKVAPLVFCWRGKTYRVEKINLVHRVKAGDGQIYYFSVSDQANFFRLSFATSDLSWRIEEVYYDG